MRDRVTILLFLTGIFAPFVRWILVPEGDPGMGAREQRQLVPRPPLTFEREALSNYPAMFDAHYRDHFGFRSTLVGWHNVVKWRWLDTSPSASVLKGKGDWLFFRDDETLDEIRGALPFELHELENWRSMLEAKRDWLAEHGIEYLAVVGPTKGVVYPEYLPEAYRPIGSSRLDQLTHYMAEASDVEVVDLRETLWTEKSRDTGGDLVFYPLGTHWTHRGALVCAREILRRLTARGVVSTRLPEFSEFERVLAPGQGDSWAERLYMEDRLTQERWSLRRPDPEVQIERITGEARSQRFVRPGSDLPRAVLYHDSYASLVKPVLAGSFSRLSCFWKYKWEVARILEDRPDVVIDMMVERALVTYRPGEELFDLPASLAAEFEASAAELFELDLDRDRVRTSKQGTATVRKRGEDRGVHLEIRRAGTLFNLPAFAFPAEGDVIVRMELTAPRDALISVLYPTRKGYQYRRNYPLFAPAGRNVAYVRLRERDLQVEGGIRFTSEVFDGKWILHAAAARAVSKAGR